jgi:hypothetical protein
MPNKPIGGIFMDFADAKWSLFWFNLLHPVIFGQIKERQIKGHLKKLAQEEILFPDDKKKTPSLSTLGRKLSLYAHGGFRGLVRKIRSDREKTRSVDKEILDKAVELKKERPFRSDDTIESWKLNYGSNFFETVSLRVK